MKKTLNLIIVLLLSLNVNLQTNFLNAQISNPHECGTGIIPDGLITDRGTDCSKSSSDWLNKYRTPGFWIPNDATPIKTILVTFVICLKNDGTGGWPDNQNTRDRLGELINQVNQVYSFVEDKSYSWTCPPANYTPIMDTRIRFEIDDIIFINNTSFNQQASINTTVIANYLQTNYPNTKNTLTHIFNNPSPTVSYWGHYTSVNGYSYVHTEQSIGNSDPAFSFHHEHVIHEYGHALGLLHNYASQSDYTQISYYDFLDDVYGQCPEPYQMSCSGCNPSAGYVCPFTCFYDIFQEYTL